MRFVLTLLVIGLAAAAPAQEPPPSIDAFIAAELPKSGAPGLAYAVAKETGVSSGAYGEALKGSGRPITEDTPFVLGSISKSITAAAVMTLVEDGKLDLDNQVQEYLDVFAASPAANVTIRQLLSHTSGFTTRQGNDTYKDRSDRDVDLTQLVATIAELTPANEPGTRWRYSNANYLVLGAIIEAVSGVTYADYIDAAILKPIRMERSFVADGAPHDDMAVGHQPWFGSKRPLSDTRIRRSTAPAGGVIATAPDLARFLAVMVNGEDDVISADSKALMMRPASAASPHYGFGWHVGSEGRVAYHSGVSPGVETLAVVDLEAKAGAVVLVNAGSGLGFRETLRLRDGVSARALGLSESSTASRWGPKTLFLTFAFLPAFFSLSALWAAFHPDGLRSKSGASGMFSLWFPLAMATGLAWLSLQLIPNMFGTPLRNLNLYLPDFVILLIATAATGVLWATVRLAVAYSGSQRQS